MAIIMKSCHHIMLLRRRISDHCDKLDLDFVKTIRLLSRSESDVK